MDNRLRVLQQPAFGEPCNRCGACCEREICPTGMKKHRSQVNLDAPFNIEERRGPCPELIYNEDGTTACGLWDEVKTWIKLGGCFARSYEEVMNEKTTLVVTTGNGLGSVS